VANANVFTKPNITVNMKIDENAGPISGPFRCLCTAAGMRLQAFLDFYNLHPNGKTAFPNIPIISGDSQQDSHPYECC